MTQQAVQLSQPSTWFCSIGLHQLMSFPVIPKSRMSKAGQPESRQNVSSVDRPLSRKPPDLGHRLQGFPEPLTDVFA